MARLKNFSNEPGCHLFTANTSAHRNLLQNSLWAQLLEDILFEYRDRGEYLIHHYVIMRNHIHVLGSTAKTRQPARIMQLVKGRFSYELKKEFGLSAPPWQEGFAGRPIRTYEEFQRAARYIQENPVRAGLCESAEQYPFSSFSGKRVLDPTPEFGAKAPVGGGAGLMSPLKRRPQGTERRPQGKERRPHGKPPD